MDNGKEQRECRVELGSFEDLARLACAYRPHPRRMYSFVIDSDCKADKDTVQHNNDKTPADKIRVASILMNLTNTIVVLYAPLPPSIGPGNLGKYVSYMINGTKESCKVSDRISNGSSSAPLVHLDSGITSLKIAESAGEIPDVFSPVRLEDLGSLARLTYDPDYPDEPELTLYAIPMPCVSSSSSSSSDVDAGIKPTHDGNCKWALGYMMMYEMDESHCVFYYVMCEKGPEMPFLRYKHDEDREPEFVEKIEHGYVYMPIIKLKRPHPIFGFGE